MSDCVVDAPARICEERLREMYPAQYLKLQQNRQAPVSQLPEEVLLRIFTLARDDDLARYRPVQILKRVTAVCRDWRNTAIDAPLLWTRHLTSSRPEGTAVWLRRAQRAPLAPLEIKINVLGGISDISKTLLAHTSHASTLELKGGAVELTEAQAMIPDGTLAPQELRVSCVQHGSDITEGDLQFFELSPSKFMHTGQLSCLELDTVNIDILSLSLPNLTTLSLRRLSTTFVPTWTQLTMLLRRLPLLKSLALDHIFPDVDPSWASWEPAQLPHLKSISLISAKASQIIAFLANILLFFPEDMEFKWSINDADYLYTLRVIALITRAKFIGPRMDKLEAEGDEKDSHLRLIASFADTISIQVAVPKIPQAVPAPAIISSFMDLFHLTGITDLDFNIFDYYCERSDLLALADKMPHLESAAVADHLAYSFFEILDCTRFDRLYFPKLRSFSFTVTDFTDCEESEWVDGAVAILASRKERGAPLDSLSFVYPDFLPDRVVARFEEVVAEVDVTTDRPCN